MTYPPAKSVFKQLLILFLAWHMTLTGAMARNTEDQKAATVVIDAGHGGKDPGTIVGNAREKNVVLDIALKLGRLIRKNQKNIKVVFTRDGDYYVPLMDRAQIANKCNADLFISIHANYCGSPEINGTETYVLGLHRTEDNLNVAKKENSVILLEDDYTKRYEGFNPNLSESYIMFELIQDTYLEKSLRFATILQSNFKEQAQRHDRDVRQAGFLVLRETSMPSVLIETGYLSNRKENSYLLTDDGRSEIAASIYHSLLIYTNKMNLAENSPAVPQKRESSGNSHSTKSQDTSVQRQEVPERKGELVSRPEPAPAPKESKEPKVESAKKTNSSNIARESEAETIKLDPEKQANPKPVENKISFAIQIGVFSRKITSESKVFKGISPVKLVVMDGKYKYFCSETDNLETAKSNYPAVLKLFPDAFVVSISNDRIKRVWDNHGK